MPLICGCSGKQQVIPPQEEKEDVTDLKVIAKIAQFPEVKQMKNKEDGSIGKEIQDDSKVPATINTTPSSNISSYSMEQETAQDDEGIREQNVKDIAIVSQEEEEEQEVSQ